MRSQKLASTEVGKPIVGGLTTPKKHTPHEVVHPGHCKTKRGVYKSSSMLQRFRQWGSQRIASVETDFDEAACNWKHRRNFPDTLHQGPDRIL